MVGEEGPLAGEEPESAPTGSKRIEPICSLHQFIATTAHPSAVTGVMSAYSDSDPFAADRAGSSVGDGLWMSRRLPVVAVDEESLG